MDTITPLTTANQIQLGVQIEVTVSHKTAIKPCITFVSVTEGPFNPLCIRMQDTQRYTIMGTFRAPVA